jgi:repressor of nif and glnA expression
MLVLETDQRAKTHEGLTMLSDRIMTLLKRRPYLGAQTLARELKTSPRVITTTAHRYKIHLMDRYEVERYADALLEAIERQEAPDGKT